MQSFSDPQLMSELAEGSRAALGELFLRHHKRVFALAYRTLGDWGAAEDVTQETFLRIWRAAGEYRAAAEFTTWLCRIVVNLCFDERRRGQRAMNGVKGLAAVQAATGAAGEAGEAEGDGAVTGRIWRALMKLNERQRQAVVLHKFGGLSYAEIAERTGWTASAVESLLVRAYRGLRKELRPGGEVSGLQKSTNNETRSL
ncbi:MAG TPA: RNA polymerase sigma factor [Anaerohalosphaeraceae bacterium]|nr:RNA polymerase sigma factor [Anaerohalosphaeraceae bacterium]HRT86688.1 RNA polymerase sigma factor [Anaerohalosphaeraceae bacterium]